jgi:hypothetical protein
MKCDLSILKIFNKYYFIVIYEKFVKSANWPDQTGKLPGNKIPLSTVLMSV